jgi:hypothetical protein
MPKLSVRDFAGKRFGLLAVLRQEWTERYKNSSWLCRCDCGAEKIFAAGNLEKARSCGCLRLSIAASKRCSVDGCEARHRCKGLCSRHYSEAMKRAAGVRPQRRNPDAPRCRAEGCVRPARKYDLCFSHFKASESRITAMHARMRVQPGGRVSAEQVREALSYDPGTGAFTWKIKVNRIRPGDPAGGISKKTGYVNIAVSGRTYRAHRLAIVWMTGEWPPEHVDHRNGDKGDNRWDNIRPASARINAQNVRTASKRNKLGVLGVSPAKYGYKATIQVDGKSIHLGYHATPEAAHSAYVAAKRVLHEGATI